MGLQVTGNAAYAADGSCLAPESSIQNGTSIQIAQSASLPGNGH